MRLQERWTALVMFSFLVFSDRGEACSVPVFRYALERWPADSYQAVLLHEGELSASQKELFERLRAARQERHLNVTALEANLADPAQERWRHLRELVSDQSLPCVVLLYPPNSSTVGPAWAGPLSAESIEQIIDSPARSSLLERLVAGQSAVWLLLESGESEKDDKAARFLEERLQHLTKTLELPELAEEDDHLLDLPKEQLKIEFSLLRVSRTNAAESVLVRMLLGSEDDLRSMSEPIVFPVFGRGRSLYAIVGAGIKEEIIDEAGAFVTGACSCQVKEMNPGVDLLLAGDWDHLIKGTFATNPELPPLSGLSGFAESDGDRSASAPSAETRPASTESTNAVAPAASPIGGPGDLSRQRRPMEAAPIGSGLRFSILLVAGGGLLAAGLFTFVLLRNRH